MNRRIVQFVLCLLIGSSSTSFAQVNDRMEAYNRFSILNNDTVEIFYAIVPKARFSYSEDKHYTSYLHDTLVTTQGATAGRILHGLYTQYFPNKNLSEQGRYRYGLKNGEWKVWYPNGIVQSFQQWRKGVLTGKIIEYDSNGKVLKSGTIKNDQFTGYKFSVDSAGKAIKIFFKKGNRVEN